MTEFNRVFNLVTLFLLRDNAELGFTEFHSVFT